MCLDETKFTKLGRFRFARIFEKYFEKSEKCFFFVYIASSKHLGGWVNPRKLCKPEDEIEGLLDGLEFSETPRV